jgi:N-acetylneuraminate synthase/pseudaminic acid synthase
MKIGNFTLNSDNLGAKVFIVAEMSGNHGGKIERALEIVKAAKRAGANAIKLQTYKADTITLNSAKEDFKIPITSPWASHEIMWNLYNDAFTPWEWHKPIFDLARSLGLEFFSSPFDESAVDFLMDLDVSAFKIASAEITHIPLLEKVAKTGKPIILSSGLAALEDIELAINTIRQNQAKNIILLKCTSSYPAPLEEANLLTIPDIVSKFNILSGLSDHTTTSVASIVSVALGASLIEKHFTLDDQKTVDSFFSLNEKEFLSFVNDIRSAEKVLGYIDYTISPSAKSSINSRRSLYVSKSIKAGDLITSDNIKCIRPSFGMHPKHYKEIIGKSFNRDLNVGDRLTWDLIE